MRTNSPLWSLRPLAFALRVELDLAADGVPKFVTDSRFLLDLAPGVQLTAPWDMSNIVNP